MFCSWFFLMSHATSDPSVLFYLLIILIICTLYKLLIYYTYNIHIIYRLSISFIRRWTRHRVPTSHSLRPSTDRFDRNAHGGTVRTSLGLSNLYSCFLSIDYWFTELNIKHVLSPKIITQKCHLKVSPKSVTQKCHPKVSPKSITQSVTHKCHPKSVAQKCCPKWHPKVALLCQKCHLKIVSHKICVSFVR